MFSRFVWIYHFSPGYVANISTGANCADPWSNFCYKLPPASFYQFQSSTVDIHYEGHCGIHKNVDNTGLTVMNNSVYKKILSIVCVEAKVLILKAKTKALTQKLFAKVQEYRAKYILHYSQTVSTHYPLKCSQTTVQLHVNTETLLKFSGNLQAP